MNTDTYANLPIAQLGHPILRQTAQVIVDIGSIKTQELISQLIVRVKSAGGVGIAAPQIFMSERAFIVCSKPTARYPDAPDMPATAMINPQFLTHGKTIEKAWEGCLSVPSLRGLVPRYTDISISYFDLQGEKHYQQLTGFIARVFQHELDHLNGVTFVDRVELTEDLMSEQEWYRQFVN